VPQRRCSAEGREWRDSSSLHAIPVTGHDGGWRERTRPVRAPSLAVSPRRARWTGSVAAENGSLSDTPQ